MLRFGNREFRNLQEQVLKNMCDIQDIEQGATVLADFGIKVVGHVDEASALPEPTTYKGNLGDAFLVGTQAPYDYYIYAKAYDGQEQAAFYNLGQFPQPGPKGDKGDAAGFGQVTATSTSVVGQPTVSVNTSGTNEAKNIAFEFGIPDVNPEYVEANPTSEATGTLQKLRVNNTIYGLGGGTKLYKHEISGIKSDNANARLIIYSTSSDLLNDRYKLMYNTEHILKIYYTGDITASQKDVEDILTISFNTSAYKLILAYISGSNTSSITTTQIDASGYTDTVTEL